MSIPQRKGEPILVETDEGVRPGTTMESLGSLKPKFDKEGTITAANAPQISDGSSGRGAHEREGTECPWHHAARSGRQLRHGGRPDSAPLLQQPSKAILKALGKVGKSVSDVDIFDTEAFAAVGIASMADLGITDEIVNVNGGAIAGHPIGMSGTVCATVLHELRRRGGGTGGRPVRRRPGRRPRGAHRSGSSTLISTTPGVTDAGGRSCLGLGLRDISVPAAPSCTFLHLHETAMSRDDATIHRDHPPPISLDVVG